MTAFWYSPYGHSLKAEEGSLLDTRKEHFNDGKDYNSMGIGYLFGTMNVSKGDIDSSLYLGLLLGSFINMGVGTWSPIICAAPVLTEDLQTLSWRNDVSHPPFGTFFQVP